MPMIGSVNTRTMISTDFILLRRLRLKIDLIPGPPHNDKLLYSKAIQVIARFEAQEVATIISHMMGVEVVTEGRRDPRLAMDLAGR